MPAQPVRLKFIFWVVTFIEVVQFFVWSVLYTTPEDAGCAYPPATDNCADAQTLIQQYNYAIVLVDATHGSFERVNNFLQQLRIHKPNQAVVTIIDSQDADFAEQLLLLGVTDFIRLPFNHNIINKVCEQAARREGCHGGAF